MEHHELLQDPFNSIYAVNCRVEGDALHCGALYVEPGNPFPVIRLSDSHVSLEVKLPDELINQPTMRKGWNVQLRLSPDHE